MNLENELEQLEANIIEFIETAKKVTLSKNVYTDGWNAKEIIAHIVFWHEYYVTILRALSRKEAPPLMEGSAEKNNQAVPIAAYHSREVLLKRLRKAQKEFNNYILKVNHLPLIPYNKTAMKRPPAEYVSVIAHHVAKHDKDLRKAIR